MSEEYRGGEGYMPGEGGLHARATCPGGTCQCYMSREGGLNAQGLHALQERATCPGKGGLHARGLHAQQGGHVNVTCPGKGGLHAQGLNAQQGGHVNATCPGKGGCGWGCSNNDCSFRYHIMIQSRSQ
jgi:hypothetical protein